MGHSDRAGRRPTRPAPVAPAGRGAAGPGTRRTGDQLPKGGGAIRGIGEKFAANPVTGTGVDDRADPGQPRPRPGSARNSSLDLRLGAGNGPFGFGWSLPLPAITREPTRACRATTTTESDVFILSGAEDLVPVLTRRRRSPTTGVARLHVDPSLPAADRGPVRPDRALDPAGRRRRPLALALHGQHPHACTARTAAPGSPTRADPRRIFSWLICETRDDQGNAVVYDYKPRTAPASTWPGRTSATARADPDRATATSSGSATATGRRCSTPTAGARCLTPARSPTRWMFEVVFDYGEHDAGRADARTRPATGPAAPDPFSTYRAGFEVRTYRLCRRVLMFHHFPDEPEVGADCLVALDRARLRATDAGRRRTWLAVTQRGYRRGHRRRARTSDRVAAAARVRLHARPTIAADGRARSTPAAWRTCRRRRRAATSWVDLDGEGLPASSPSRRAPGSTSATSAAAGSGPGRRAAASAPLARRRPGGGASSCSTSPATASSTSSSSHGPRPGSARTDDGGWAGFPVRRAAAVDWTDPNLRFVDLTGDGHADVLITEDDALHLAPVAGRGGFGPAQRVGAALDEERGPRLVFADGTQIDLPRRHVRRRPDRPRPDPQRRGLLLAQPRLRPLRRQGRRWTTRRGSTPGPVRPAPHPAGRHRRHRHHRPHLPRTATASRLYFNQSGNGWSPPSRCRLSRASTTSPRSTVADLLGNGTACLVWSSPLPGDARRPMRYVDLMGGQQAAPARQGGQQPRRRDPRPATRRRPSSTCTTSAPASRGSPGCRSRCTWSSGSRPSTAISRNRFVTRYAYHHGYFDGVEREFRGFGMVEQIDGESFVDHVSGVEAVNGNQADSPELFQRPGHDEAWYQTARLSTCRRAGNGRPAPA